MLQVPSVRRALSHQGSSLQRQLEDMSIWGRDSDISSGIGLHVPKYTQLLAKSSIEPWKLGYGFASIV
ncbi:hypothetical protein Tco_1007639 [Tanacetum coccineum]